MLIAGVDEAGRGPLAGPVIAAAVILDSTKPVAGLADSKKLTAKRRAALATEIKQHALAWALGQAEVAEIDTLNILQASLLAMSRAIMKLSIVPDEVLVDGNQCPQLPYPVQAVIKGDSKVAAISAASILAKVTRDELLLNLHQDYPVYGFDQHKGYPTKQHLAALAYYGASPVHRQSFAPVRASMLNSSQNKQ